jgi:WD40 repeat protein
VHKKGITHMEITLYEVWDAQKKVFAKKNVLMTAASDKILKLWHFDRDSKTIALHCQTIAKSKVKFCDQMLIFEKDFSLAHPDRIQCYKMTNDGKYLYTGGSQSLVKCWETKNWKMVKDFSEYQAFKDFWVVCLNVTTEKVSFASKKIRMALSTCSVAPPMAFSGFTVFRACASWRRFESSGRGL